MLKIEPPFGSVTGGTKVVVQGTGLSSKSQCRFGTELAVEHTFDTLTGRLTCTTPPFASPGWLRLTIAASSGTPFVVPTSDTRFKVLNASITNLVPSLAWAEAAHEINHTMVSGTDFPPTNTLVHCEWRLLKILSLPPPTVASTVVCQHNLLAAKAQHTHGIGLSSFSKPHFTLLRPLEEFPLLVWWHIGFKHQHQHQHQHKSPANLLLVFPGCLV